MYVYLITDSKGGETKKRLGDAQEFILYVFLCAYFIPTSFRIKAGVLHVISLNPQEM